MTEQLPVTVIGGYLGSGKTTMVNHLLRNANGLRLAVLVNEFGELAIDEDLIEAEDDDIISIAGGCVCCSFGSDLTGALIELAKLVPQPDHVLIESSGVAIPSAIAGSVSLLEGFRTDGIVIVADAEIVQSSACDKYMSDTVLRQIADANIIVLNKTDLVSETQLSDTKQWLGLQNSGARVVETTHSIVPPSVILDSFLVLKTLTAPHFEASNLEMMTINFEKPVDAKKLAKKLADDDLGLIRAKGFVTSLKGQNTLIQVVGRRWETSPAPDNKLSGIVCLGFKAMISKQDIATIENAIS
ncbi:MAG: CobW family GTP-binding protein [Sulfitobacter sp.]